MIIIGNILGFLSAAFCTLSTFQKTKKKILIMQGIDCTCNIFACAFLNGISGAIMSICALIRNIICYKIELSKRKSLILTIIIAIIAIIYNNIGLLGILPIIAVIEYTYIVCITNNIKIITSALAINNLMWSIYNITIHNYIGAIGNIIITFCSLINSSIKIENKK